MTWNDFDVDKMVFPNDSVGLLSWSSIVIVAVYVLMY